MGIYIGGAKISVAKDFTCFIFLRVKIIFSKNNLILTRFYSIENKVDICSFENLKEGIR